MASYLGWQVHSLARPSFPLLPTEETDYAKYVEVLDDNSRGRPKLLSKGEFGEVRLVPDTTIADETGSSRESAATDYVGMYLLVGTH